LLKPKPAAGEGEGAAHQAANRAILKEKPLAVSQEALEDTIDLTPTDSFSVLEMTRYSKVSQNQDKNSADNKENKEPSHIYSPSNLIIDTRLPQSKGEVKDVGSEGTLFLTAPEKGPTTPDEVDKNAAGPGGLFATGPLRPEGERASRGDASPESARTSEPVSVEQLLESKPEYLPPGFSIRIPYRQSMRYKFGMIDEITTTHVILTVANYGIENTTYGTIPVIYGKNAPVENCYGFCSPIRDVPFVVVLIDEIEREVDEIILPVLRGEIPKKWQDSGQGKDMEYLHEISQVCIKKDFSGKSHEEIAQAICISIKAHELDHMIRDILGIWAETNYPALLTEIVYGQTPYWSLYQLLRFDNKPGSAIFVEEYTKLYPFNYTPKTGQGTDIEWTRNSKILKIPREALDLLCMRVYLRLKNMPMPNVGSIRDGSRPEPIPARPELERSEQFGVPGTNPDLSQTASTEGESLSPRGTSPTDTAVSDTTSAATGRTEVDSSDTGNEQIKSWGGRIFSRLRARISEIGHDSEKLIRSDEELIRSAYEEVRNAEYSFAENNIEETIKILRAFRKSMTKEFGELSKGDKLYDSFYRALRLDIASIRNEFANAEQAFIRLRIRATKISELPRSQTPSVVESLSVRYTNENKGAIPESAAPQAVAVTSAEPANRQTGKPANQTPTTTIQHRRPGAQHEDAGTLGVIQDRFGPGVRFATDGTEGKGGTEPSQTINKIRNGLRSYFNERIRRMQQVLLEHEKLDGDTDHTLSMLREDILKAKLELDRGRLKRAFWYLLDAWDVLYNVLYNVEEVIKRFETEYDEPIFSKNDFEEMLIALAKVVYPTNPSLALYMHVGLFDSWFGKMRWATIGCVGENEIQNSAVLKINRELQKIGGLFPKPSKYLHIASHASEIMVELNKLKQVIIEDENIPRLLRDQLLNEDGPLYKAIEHLKRIKEISAASKGDTQQPPAEGKTRQRRKPKDEPRRGHYNMESQPPISPDEAPGTRGEEKQPAAPAAQEAAAISGKPEPSPLDTLDTSAAKPESGVSLYPSNAQKGTSPVKKLANGTNLFCDDNSNWRPYAYSQENAQRRYGRLMALKSAVPGHAHFFETVLAQAYDTIHGNMTDDGRDPLPLASIIQEIFKKAGEGPNHGRDTRIVFLKARADPMYEMAKTVAHVTGAFPEERMHSVWATMENYKEISNDPVQAAYFVKYLHDQGALTPDTNRLIFIDTDSRMTQVVGTELAVYKTLLSEAVIRQANSMFGLNLKAWNVGGGQEAEMLYVYLDSPKRIWLDAWLKGQGISPDDYFSRMRVNAMKVSGSPIGPSMVIDHMTKLESINAKFILNQEGMATVQIHPPYQQRYRGEELLICHHLEYACLIMETLNVLESFGFDVSKEEEAYIEKLWNVLKTIETAAPQAAAADQSSAISRQSSAETPEEKVKDATKSESETGKLKDNTTAEDKLGKNRRGVGAAFYDDDAFTRHLSKPLWDLWHGGITVIFDENSKRAEAMRQELEKNGFDTGKVKVYRAQGLAAIDIEAGKLPRITLALNNLRAPISENRLQPRRQFGNALKRSDFTERFDAINAVGTLDADNVMERLTAYVSSKEVGDENVAVVKQLSPKQAEQIRLRQSAMDLRRARIVKLIARLTERSSEAPQSLTTIMLLKKLNVRIERRLFEKDLAALIKMGLITYSLAERKIVRGGHKHIRVFALTEIGKQTASRTISKIAEYLSQVHVAPGDVGGDVGDGDVGDVSRRDASEINTSVSAEHAVAEPAPETAEAPSKQGEHNMAAEKKSTDKDADRKSENVGEDRGTKDVGHGTSVEATGENLSPQRTPPDVHELHNQLFIQLEQMARGKIPDDRAEEIIAELLALGTERADVQRSLLLYSRLKNIPISGLFENYHISNKAVRFQPVADTKLMFGKDKNFKSIFGGKKVMLVEVHPDDLFLNAGLFSNGLANIAQDIKFVTAIPDSTGVAPGDTNYLFRVYSLAQKIENEKMKRPLSEGVPDASNLSLEDAQRFIRSFEANTGAFRLGLEQHTDLGLQLALKQPVYDIAGNLLSFDSVFNEPSEEERRKVDDLIRSNPNTDVYLISSPFSNHPQHRITSRMFLEAIYRHNRNARILFWDDEHGFRRHDMKANLYYFYIQKLQDFKNKWIDYVYASQAKRRGEGFYVQRSEEIALNAASAGCEEINRLGGFADVSQDEFNHLYPYAERLLEVTIVDRPSEDTSRIVSEQQQRVEDGPKGTTPPAAHHTEGAITGDTLQTTAAAPNHSPELSNSSGTGQAEPQERGPSGGPAEPGSAKNPFDGMGGTKRYSTGPGSDENTSRRDKLLEPKPTAGEGPTSPIPTSEAGLRRASERVAPEGTFTAKPITTAVQAPTAEEIELLRVSRLSPDERLSRLDSLEITSLSLRDVWRLLLDARWFGVSASGEIHLASDQNDYFVSASKDGIAVRRLDDVKKFAMSNLSEKDRRILCVVITEAESVKRMPIHRLLDALELSKLRFNRLPDEIDGSGSLKIYEISLPKRDKKKAISQGLEILQYELAPVEKFKLIYSWDNKLLGVMPVLDKEVIAKVAGFGGYKESLNNGFEIFYFDFTEYYFSVPRYSGNWSEEIKCVEAATLPCNMYKIALRSYVRDNAESQPLWKEIAAHSFYRKPFIYAEISKNGTVNTKEFRADEFDDYSGMFKPREDVHQVIFPVYPTVFTPAFEASSSIDKKSEMPIIFNDPRFDLSNADTILVVGPGTGIEAWAAWLRTGKDIYVTGINPIEVANTLALADIVGARFIGEINDGILRPDGRPVFNKQFDRMIWDMPSVTLGEGHAPKQGGYYNRYWDFDSGGNTLKQFAKSLSTVMTPNGKILVWNSCLSFNNQLDGQGPDFVEAIFSKNHLNAVLIDSYIYDENRAKVGFYIVSKKVGDGSRAELPVPEDKPSRRGTSDMSAEKRGAWDEGRETPVGAESKKSVPPGGTPPASGDVFPIKVESVTTGNSIQIGAESVSVPAAKTAQIVTAHEIKTTIDAMESAGELNFDEARIKQATIRKLASMRLVKGGKFLVVGPGDSDKLPILLARLGLKVSAIDTDERCAKAQKDIAKRFGLEGKVDVFASYSGLGEARFDYISVFGVLHVILGHTEQAFISRNEADLEGIEKPCEKKLADALELIINRLNAGGYLFINLPAERSDDLRLACIKSVVANIGEETGISLLIDSGIDIDNLSLTRSLQTEPRVGITFNNPRANLRGNTPPTPAAAKTQERRSSGGPARSGSPKNPFNGMGGTKRYSTGPGSDVSRGDELLKPKPAEGAGTVPNEPATTAQMTAPAVLHDIQTALHQVGIHGLEILLFGSHADNKENPQDIDLILMVAPGISQEEGRGIIQQIDTIERQVGDFLRGKGYREIQFHDINPLTRENYFRLWKTREFFARNKFLWFVGADYIHGYQWPGDRIASEVNRMPGSDRVSTAQPVPAATAQAIPEPYSPNKPGLQAGVAAHRRPGAKYEDTRTLSTIHRVFGPVHFATGGTGGKGTSPSAEAYEITRRNMLKTIAAFCLSGNVSILQASAPQALIESCLVGIDSESEIARLLRLVKPALEESYDAYFGGEGSGASSVELIKECTRWGEEGQGKVDGQSGTRVEAVNNSMHHLLGIRQEYASDIRKVNNMCRELEHFVTTPDNVEKKELKRIKKLIREFAKFHAETYLWVDGREDRSRAKAALIEFNSYSLNSRARVVLAVFRKIEIPAMEKIISDHIQPSIEHLRELLKDAAQAERKPTLPVPVEDKIASSAAQTSVLTAQVIPEPYQPALAAQFTAFMGQVANLRSIVANELSPVVDIPDAGSQKALILYADNILKQGAVIDLEETVRKASVLNGGTIVIYGNNSGNAAILEKIINSANSSINVIKIEPREVIDRCYTGIDEAEELRALIRLAKAKGVSKGALLGVIKGPALTGYEDRVRSVSREYELPVVSFESNSGIYSFYQALAAVIRVRREDGPKSQIWAIDLPPIRKVTEDIKKAYEDYLRALDEIETKA